MAYGSATREERDADHDRERRAAGDAEDAGVGERIARHGLHRRARQRQRRADEDREDGARERGRRRRPATTPSTSPAERGEDLADADLAHAERDGCDAQQAQHAGRPRRAMPDAPPPSAAGLRRPAAVCASAWWLEVLMLRRSVQCAREQREVLVDAPADRERRRVGRGGERRRVLEDGDAARSRSRGSATAAGRPAAAR